MAAAVESNLQEALRHAQHLLSADPALALNQSDEILRVVADQPNALMLRGLALRSLGRREEALATLNHLVRQRPDWAAAWMEWGHLHFSSGALDAAEHSYRKAIELQNALPGAWEGLGNCRLLRGDESGAQEAFEQQLRHALRDRELLVAADALARNELPVAERLLKSYLLQHPTNAPALRMLAEVAARLGRQEDSLQLLERCLELAPGFHEARLHRVLMLNRSNRADSALAELRILLEHAPHHLAYRNLRAVLLGQIGEYEQAIAQYRDVLSDHSTHPQIWLSLAHALKTAGQTDEAITAYREAIRLQPDFGDAYWSLANLKTFRFSEDDVARMRAHLRRTDLRDEDRLHFEFALGKAMEDDAEHEAAFTHYAAGNALRRKQIRYSADENHQRVQRSIQVLDREFFAARRGWGHDSAEPIFIVGMPRAGSTLIEQILASHSQVEGTMELPELLAITRHLRLKADKRLNTAYVELLPRLDAEEVHALAQRYLDNTRIHRKAGKPRFIDKMPNNFAHVGLIHLLFPNATIIDARRHPMACCFSVFKQHFARGQHFAYDLVDMGRYYADYVRLMAHYDSVLPGRMLRVFNEALIEDGEEGIRNLLSRSNLDFEEGCLRFHENARPVRTASSEQVRRPLNRDGMDQWRPYASWLGPLQDTLGDIAERYPEVPPL